MKRQASRILAVGALALILLAACGETRTSTLSSVSDAEMERRDELANLFSEGIADNAPCAELFSYRNAYEGSTESYFDPKLREIGCFSSSSDRTDESSATQSDAPATHPASPATTMSSSPALTDPIDRMEIAFVGGYTKQQIKTRIDRVMSLYGLSSTPDNYSRAGSVLVALRKEYGPSEMDILNYMVSIYVEGVDLSFPDAAAISVAFLSVGDG